ncbi:hypothetical protein [Pedobacter hartonius]|uniref:SD-repeat containing protein B domain-containing protein n=1 Tax=Pedobacter hartonius TaxID=425514 RepID=A0A1H4GQG5_9SPHI|nr:hypothetical protein [Pedobacter hartonius]SEB11784.1 hypothetical protein SAMN05443550_11115 [Pedobacter hartonius]
MKNQTVYRIWKYSLYRHSPKICRIAIVVMLLTFHPLSSVGQVKPDDEDISVSLDMPGLGTADIPAIIRGKDSYLSVTDFFTFLKINVIPSASQDSVSGFLLDPRDIYLIDRLHHLIWYQGKRNNIAIDDLISTATTLYLKSDYFGKIFGLNSLFNFRSLSVSIDTKLDLPVFREIRQKLTRDHINHTSGIVKVDSTVGRSYSGFKMGMADWSVVSTQQRGAKYTGLNLSLGAALAGGEADVFLNYNNTQPFTVRNQFYMWRFVDNNNPLFRQFIAGKIAPQTIASIYGPVTGIQLTNRSSINRNAFGTYKLSDITEPGWKVELYVNNELVDYQQADASGFFSFDVPIVYGNTLIDLRFYGPWGEERSQRRNINIPFNFLPEKEFEYTLYAGIVDNGSNHSYARGNLNYGLTRKITIGGGMEYFSAIPSRKETPFLNTSFRLTSNLLLYSEYAYGVRTKGILNYRLSSDLELELNYIRYHQGQQAVLFNYNEERKAIINFPIRGRNFTLFSRLTLDQVFLPSAQFTNAELLFSGVIAGINTNLTTFSRLSGENAALTYSILSQTYRLPQRLLFTPKVQYEYETKKVITTKFEIERPILNCGFIKLSFERNFRSNSYTTGIGLRYDFSFARTAFAASHNNQSGFTLTQSATGSLLYDQASHYLTANNNSNVGKAGFTVIAYLDLNGNGVKDPAEPKAAGLSLRMNGGMIKYNEKDTLIRITNLEAFRTYTLSLNANGFDNLTWQLKKPVISITAEPNQFRKIEIPVTVAAEVSGMVYVKNNNERQGLGKIRVNFYDQQAQLIKQVLSESDGYFSYLGLVAGSYTVSIDTTQLQHLKLTASPANLPVTIRRSIDGDVVDGLEFILSTIPNDFQKSP